MFGAKGNSQERQLKPRISITAGWRPGRAGDDRGAVCGPDQRPVVQIEAMVARHHPRREVGRSRAAQKVLREAVQIGARCDTDPFRLRRGGRGIGAKRSDLLAQDGANLVPKG